MKQSVSFTQGPVGRTLYTMSLPMVIGLFATMSFNAVDTFFVAQLGEKPLAAMSFTFPVVFIVQSFSIGLGAGMSSLVARLLGKSKTLEAQQVGTLVLAFAFFATLILSVIGALALEPIFKLLGAGDDMIPLIADYMLIWFVGAPPMVAATVATALFRATGNSKAVGTLMLWSALLNAVLDPLLIFGLGPFPRLEIEGAAYASLICRLLLTLAVGILIVRWKLVASIRSMVRADILGRYREFFRIAVPAMATNMIIPLSGAITVALAANYGYEAVAGLGVALRIEPMVLIAFYALSSVMGPFMGQNMQDNERQLRALKVTTQFCIAAGLLFAVLLWLFGEMISSLFCDSDVVLQVAVSYLSIVPISYGLYGLVMSINASFNGLGNPLPATLLSFLRVLGFYVPLLYLGQHWWGIKGIFAAAAFSNIVVGVLGYRWLKSRLSVNLQPAPNAT